MGKEQGTENGLKDELKKWAWRIGLVAIGIIGLTYLV